MTTTGPNGESLNPVARWDLLRKQAEGICRVDLDHHVRGTAAYGLQSLSRTGLSRPFPQIRNRIDWAPVDPDFVMQMRPCGISGRAHKTKFLPRNNLLAMRNIHA